MQGGGYLALHGGMLIEDILWGGGYAGGGTKYFIGWRYVLVGVCILEQ